MIPVEFETLLRDLEEVTEQALSLTRAEACSDADFAHCHSLVEKRSTLIRRLENVEGPLSYTDYNRLVIIGFQGQRLQENLLRLRMQLAAAVAANRQQSAYAKRVLGCFPAEIQSKRSETA
jgi:hypothetical protein